MIGMVGMAVAFMPEAKLRELLTQLRDTFTEVLDE